MQSEQVQSPPPRNSAGKGKRNGPVAGRSVGARGG